MAYMLLKIHVPAFLLRYELYDHFINCLWLYYTDEDQNIGL